MADAAVEFLLDNLKQVLSHHLDLIQNARSRVEELEKDLRLFKAYLKDSTKNRNRHEADKELTRQIIHIVYEIEDVVDNFITEAHNKSSKGYLNKLVHAPVKQVSLAKDVERIGGQVKTLLGRIELVMKGRTTVPETEIPEVTKIPRVREDKIVGFEKDTQEIITYLKQETRDLDVISIIGLPGLGKTTLAGKIFRDPYIQFQFPTRIWVYVSQEFKRRDVFLTILSKFTNTENLKAKTDQEIAQMLRENLEKVKFLIVMDDVWSADAWLELKDAFPKMHKTGKILITSRHEEVALQANRSRDPYKLGFLTDKESLQLLHLEVFDESDCPKELDEYGEIIVKKCGGLPLAIVVIGGILVKKALSGDMMSQRNTWREVSEIVPDYLKEDSNLENIIALSYNKLPHHLRPCFLYLGMFPEDFEIPVWTLIRLWIAEGLVEQTTTSMTLEQYAEGYLKELVNRNLVMVAKMSTDGKIKCCRVHDTLRQFCKNESGSQKENFFQEMKKSAEGVFEPCTRNLESNRRLCIHSDILDSMSYLKRFGPQVRSFVCFSKEEPCLLSPEYVSSIPTTFKLLRILDSKTIIFPKFPRDLACLVHLRYVVLSSHFKMIPKALDELWNLQTLAVYTTLHILEIKANIWRMLQLRHVKTNASAILPKRENSKKELGEKLQTLGNISPQSCTEDGFDRLRGLRKLGIRGLLVSLDTEGLNKLEKLDKLKLVNDIYGNQSSGAKLPRLPEPYKFPPNLRSLTLCSTSLDWVHMSTLGVLGKLEVLKLKENAFVGHSWEVSNGHFRHLEVLHIERTDLVVWVVAEANHFPRLKCLVLMNCEKLEGIPPTLSEVQSFQRLDVKRVTKSAAASAREIEAAKKKQQEQEPDKRIKFRLNIAPGDE